MWPGQQQFLRTTQEMPVQSQDSEGLVEDQTVSPFGADFVTFVKTPSMSQVGGTPSSRQSASGMGPFLVV